MQYNIVDATEITGREKKKNKKQKSHIFQQMRTSSFGRPTELVSFKMPKLI